MYYLNKVHEHTFMLERKNAFQNAIFFIQGVQNMNKTNSADYVITQFRNIN
jgi:hypothetical protein